MNRALTILTILLITAVNAGAETSVMNLRQVTERAVANNLELQKLEKEYRASVIACDAALGSLIIPQITLSGNAGLLDLKTASNNQFIGIMSESTDTYVIPTYDTNTSAIDRYIIFPVVNTRTATNIHTDFYSLSLAVKKDLFTGFRNWNTYLIREKQKRFYQAMLGQKKNEVTVNASLHFYRYLLMKEYTRLFQDLTANSATRLEQTREKYQAGLIAQYDYLRMQVQYQNQYRLYQAKQSELTNALLQLNLFLNVKDEADRYEYSGNLADLTNYQDISGSETDYYQRALKNNPAILEAELRQEGIVTEKSIAESEYWPQVFTWFNNTLDYRYNSAYDLNRSWVNNWNIGVGFSLSLDAFLPFSRVATTRDGADERLKQQKLALQDIRNNLYSTVHSLFQSISDLKLQLENQKVTIDQAALALKLANDKFSASRITQLELSDVESAYIETSLNYYQSLYMLYSEWMNLAKYSGGSLSAPAEK